MLAECWQNAINLHQNIEKKYNYFTRRIFINF